MNLPVKTTRVFLLIILAAALAGCMGYRLGPTNGLPAGCRTVEVRSFVNKTRDPRVSEYVAGAMRREIQRDGSDQLEPSGRGDILLSGEITGLERSGVSYTTNDGLTPQEYTIVLTAHIIAVNINSGHTNLNRNVLGRTYIRLGNDQSSAEREAIPMLAADLAQNAVSLLVDGDF